MNKHRFPPLACLGVSAMFLAAFAFIPVASAQPVNAQVRVDFNDYKPGALYAGPTSTQPINIDVGFAASATYWQGTTTPVQVVSGSLALAGPTNYAITQQSGTAMMMRVLGTPATAPRQQFRALAAPMVGTIWGSFLVRQSKTDSEGASVYQLTGITFNSPSISLDNAAYAEKRGIFALGSSLVAYSHTGTIGGIPAGRAENQFTANQTALTLFRYDTNSKRLDVWVDPDLPSHPLQLPAASAAWSGTCDLLGSTGTFSTLGVGGNYYVDGGRSGDLDAIRLDNSADGYFAVTGISKFTPVDVINASVIADFNDIPASGMSNLYSPNNAGTGYGFDATENKWSVNTSIILLRGVDLSAPASTRYAITQSAATPRSAAAYGSGVYTRQNSRQLAVPLTGMIWGSFLVKNTLAGHTAGLTFNYPSTAAEPAAKNRICAEGTDLVVYAEDGTPSRANNVFTLNESALVLFSYDTSTMQLKVWVNPVLPDSSAGVATLTPALVATSDILTNSGLSGSAGKLMRIGVMANTLSASPPDAQLAYVDAIYLASDETGYYAVTGIIPKPLIITQPAPQSLTAGGTATFAVTATGNWDLSYQWTHDGAAIASATNSTLTIPDVNSGNAGTYRVTVANTGGIYSTVSTDATLVVGTIVPVEIVSGPTITPASSVASGTSVSMIVSATGTEPITYQWMKSGSAITGATSGTYTINPVTVAHAGNYSVTLNNPAGTPVTSGTVTLSVLGPPTITTQPLPQTVFKGESASFSVTANCPSPMTYQWYHSGTAITGATGATYTIPNVTPAAGGGYSVRIFNADYPDYFVNSSTIALTVKLADVLDATVIADFNDCNAPVNGRLDNALNNNTGIGFLNALWEGNSGVPCIAYEDLMAPSSTRYAITQTGNPRSAWGNNATITNIRQGYRTLAAPLSGKVWGSFLVNNGNVEHRTGLTFNLVGGANGTINETNVAYTPRWLYARGTSLVVRSNTGDIVADVANAFTIGQTALVLFSYDTVAKKLTVWVDPVLTDKVEDMDSVTPTFTSGATPLDLFGTEFSGALGRIGVMVTGGQTSATNAGKIDSLRFASGANGYYQVTGIAIQPQIITQPTSVVIDYGQPATFTVSATGISELSYQWRHSGSILPLETGTTLNFASAQPGDRGQYDVVVSHRHGSGSVTSNIASLLFRNEVVPLAITSLQLIPSSTVHTGTTVSMIVTGTGTEPITYQWLKSGTAITGATSGTYTINSVTPADTGGYSVRLNDLANMPIVSNTLSLSVLGPPIILTQPASQTINGTGTATFTVSATSVATLSYQWYFEGSQIMGATGTTHVIQNVQMPDQGGYSVKVTLVDYPEYFTNSSTATLTVLPTDLRGAPVIADFNDYSTGNTDIKIVANTGIGFGEANWSTATGAIQTIAGDLTPPASTRYGIRQPLSPGVANSVYLNNSGAMMRIQERNLAAPLSGVVWGSFLVNNTHVDHRSGLTFNTNQTAGTINDSTGPFTRWIIAHGTSLVIFPNSGITDAIIVPGVFTLSQSALVLFSFDTATKHLKVWVNPVLTDNAGDMASLTPTFDSGSTPVDLFGTTNQIDRIGVLIGTIAGTVPTNSPKLDSVRLSADASGYYHVTGVSVPPTIVTQPAAKTAVNRGASATLTVSATGVGPLLYQWTFWGNPIAGANSASLAIPNVQAANVGEYQVIVTNDGGAGSVTSNIAVLLVNEDIIPLAITQQPALSPSTVTDGTNITLSVTAAGTPPIKYQWRKNGAAIAGATGASYSISTAQVADSGDYDVVVSDLARATVTSSVVPLRVQIPPSIITQPQNAVSYEGGPVSFMVEAKGTDITYVWKRNGTAIAGAGGATLTLAATTAADNGASFTVTVANGVGTVDSAAATLTLQGSVKPPASGTVASLGDATIENGANASANLNGSGLLVCATGTTGARKSYLAFDLPLAVASTDAAGASLTLTLGNPPAFVGSGSAATPPNNPVRLRLHGIINNNDTWTETAVTWNNAPAAADSNVAPGAGAIPLAEVTVDTAVRRAGDKVTFADARIAQYLNWAAGRRGNLYGNGIASDADHKLTFIVTSIDEATQFAGLRFADKEAGAASAPALAYEIAATGTAAPPVLTALENERFIVTPVISGSTYGVDVKDKTSGATAHFSPTFEVVYSGTNPAMAYADRTINTMGSPAGTATLTLPTWKSVTSGTQVHSYDDAIGTRTTLQPDYATINDGQIVWRFTPPPANADGVSGFNASLDLPAGKAAPRLRWTLSPASGQYYAVSFRGLPATPNENVNSFYMPGLWNERRFPDQQYVIDEIRATTPAVLRQLAEQTVVAGAAVDPFEIPTRVAGRKADSYNIPKDNSQFGLSTNNLNAGSNLPSVIAPLYGDDGSLTDGTLSFSVRLIVKDGSIDDGIRDVVTNVYGFHDYRQNLAGGSLNTAIDNLFDLLLDETVDPQDGVAKGHSYWLPNEKANDYRNDKPNYARFQSAATALGLAMVRDDSMYYEKRALPTIEYFISRDNQLVRVDGFDTDYPMGGPVKAYGSTDFFALLSMTGGRTSAFSTLADQAWAKSPSGTTPLLQVVGDALTKGEAYTASFTAWHSLLAGYRATGKAEYLKDARVIADNYIKYRFTEGPAADFGDVPGSFWNQLAGRWELLLETYELTGEATYAEHAMKAMDGFIRHINFAPGINDLTVDGNSAETPAIKHSLVSEVGLTSEGAHSSISHRGIFMSAYAAPSLMRVAGLTQDPFYSAVGRASIVGRWLNYPGYTIRGYYKADLLTPWISTLWYEEYKERMKNSAHYNHPAMQAAIAIDFLMADTELKSAEQIKFPYQVSDSRIYFRGRVFGGAAGHFYDETGVWPWLPRGLVTLSGENAVQLNYVAGHGNGRLYIAFMNQSQSEVTAAVSVRGDKVTLTPGARMRVWRDNVPQNYGTFANGATTVTVSPGGITAIAIEDATPVLDLQKDYNKGHGSALPAESFAQRNNNDLGQITGVVLSLSPSRQSAYVYTNAGTVITTGTDPVAVKLSSAELTYSIDGGAPQTIAKNEYPFEFSVPLPQGAQYVTYAMSGVPVGGASATAEETTLYLSAPPVITQHPQNQDKLAGQPVLFTVVADDPGGLYTYQWYKDDAAIPGATSASLAFIAALADDGGVYHAVVSKGLIQVASDPATLTVAAPPDVVINTQPAGTTQNAGTPYTLAVDASNATAYQWYKDGQELPGATSATLELSGAAYESGSYHVVVRGMISGAESSLTSGTAAVSFTPVAGAPVIRTQPQGKAATVGTAFTLSVAATGATSYQWYHDNLAVNGATSSALTLAGAWADNGSYHVVVSNAAGSTVSSRAIVTILPLPASITVQPLGGTVQNGSPHTLTIDFTGQGDIQWRKNGVPIPGATSRTLVLSGTPADAGVYDVVITTTSGAITSSPATITITANPGSPLAASSGLTVDTSGVIYVTDAQRHVIQAITGTTLATFAGTLDSFGLTDGKGTAAKFNKPADIVAHSGVLYVADAGNNLIRAVQISTANVTTLMTGSSTIMGFTSVLSNPSALAVDSAGNIYVADTGNNVIRKITPSGTSVIGTTIAGSSAGASGTANGVGAQAGFNAPAGIALLEAGASGTLFVADTGNNTLRAIALDTGAVSTIAGHAGVPGCDDGAGSSALLNAPRGLVLNGSDLYIADTGNSLVRVFSGGAVTTIAGYPGIGATPGVPGFKDGSGTNAWFNHPQDIAISRDGTLYIADTGNKAIRTIDTDDNVATLKVTATASGSSTPVNPGGNTGGGGGGGGGGAISLWALALMALAAGARRVLRR